MSNELTNVERLIAADLLDPKYLDDTSIAKINGVTLTDEEIQTLQSVKEKLGLDRLELHAPSGALQCMGHL